MADQDLGSGGGEARSSDGRASGGKPSEVTPKKPSPLRKPAVRAALILAGLGLAIVAVIIFAGWWTHGRFVQGTDDAYVRADQVTVSPKVNGYVEAVYVSENQSVEAGQVLVKIDPARRSRASRPIWRPGPPTSRPRDVRWRSSRRRWIRPMRS